MKKRVLFFAVFFLAAVLAAGCGEGMPRLKPLPRDGVVLAFGDSLTYGTGAEPGRSYPEDLEALIGRKVVRSGVPGEVTGAGLKRLTPVLDAVRPDLVILCHGGNDILRRMDLRVTAENLKAMIGIIRGRGGDAVLVGVPAPGLWLRTASFYGKVAEETGVPFLEGILTEILSTRALKADQIHPNGRGYARMASAVADFLVREGALTGEIGRASCRERV